MTLCTRQLPESDPENLFYLLAVFDLSITGLYSMSCGL